MKLTKSKLKQIIKEEYWQSKRPSQGAVRNWDDMTGQLALGEDDQGNPVVVEYDLDTIRVPLDVFKAFTEANLGTLDDLDDEGY